MEQKQTESLLTVTTGAISAALFITLAATAYLRVGGLGGAILFAFGLLCVCIYGSKLFTGMAGYIRSIRAGLWGAYVFVVNCCLGWFFGRLVGIADPALAEAAAQKVSSWNFDIPFMIQAFFCGIIMFVAVNIWKNGSPIGVLFGVPLFIMCGFQHSIANAIYCGIGGTFTPLVILAGVCNWLGSFFISTLIYRK